MERVVRPEMMDDPGVPNEALGQGLAYIRAVNRRWGGTAASLRRLQAWAHAWPKDRPVRILDVGTGSADIPLAMCRWARARGSELRITAIDLHEGTLRVAREHTAGEPWITLQRSDALNIKRDFGAGAFDYAHAGMFLHHLRETAVLTVLAAMDQVASRGIIWNDLMRSRLGALAIDAATCWHPEIVRHDARASVRAGFTRREVLAFASRLDLTYCTYHASLLHHRFTLAGQRPGTWPP